MARRKKPPRRLTAPKKHPRPRLHAAERASTSLVRSLWGFFVAASVIIAIVAGVFSFKPRLSIRKPSDTTGTPSGQVFTVSNDGWLSLRNIEVRPSVVLTYRPIVVPGYLPETDRLAFGVEPIRAGTLESGQSLSIRLPASSAPSSVRKIAVEFAQSYDAWWLPAHHAAGSRYITYEGLDGKLNWEECMPPDCRDSDFTVPKSAKGVFPHPEGAIGDSAVYSVTTTFSAPKVRP